MTPSKDSQPLDIAIVGMSLFVPGASTVGPFWANLAEGVDSITEAPSDIIDPVYFGAKDNSRPDRFYNNRGGFATRGLTDPLRYGILPIAAEGADPDQIVSLMMSEGAMVDAGIFAKGISLEHACVIIGKGNFAGLPQLVSSEVVRSAEQLSWMLRSALPELPDSEIENIRLDYQSRFGRYQGDTVTASMPNLVAAGVAHHFDIHGPAYTVDAACASGLVALQHGIRLIQLGECDLAVIGAMHTAHSAVFWSAFNLMGAMSKKGVIAPFSRDADGLLIGQGGGFLVLKTRERAEADNDRIYALVQGVAVGSDGSGSNVLVTNADGQRRVLQDAWAQSGLDPENVGYVETHGTGTPIGDATELHTLSEFFGDSQHPKAYLGSVKSNIGHLMPAAGMAGLIKTVLSLYHRKIPPTLHCENPLGAMAESRFDPARELIDWEAAKLPLVAGVNAFGFGGSNAHAVLTAYEEPAIQRPRYRADRHRHYCPEIFTLAAPTKEALLGRVDVNNYTNGLGSLLGSPEDPYRLAIFNPTDERLRLAADIVRRDKPWRGRSDIWFTNKPLLHSDAKIVFMFPGFNLSELVEHESIEDDLGLEFVKHPGANADEQGIADFFYTSQLVHQALLKTGVTADIYTGHSIGEWHAARASGILDESFDRLNVEFGQDPAHQLRPEDLPDFRSVVITSGLTDATLRRLLDLPDVHLANDNCPSQVVLTALGYSLPALREALDAEHIFYQELPFSSGLHTPYVAPIIDVFVDAMAPIPVHKGIAPLWSAVTLAEVSASKDERAAAVLAAELMQPVRFRQLIEKLYDEQGARVFIQVGCGTLTGFVEDTLKGRDFATVSSMVSVRSAVDQLRRIHGALYVEGGACDYGFMGVRTEIVKSQSIFLLPEGAPMLKSLDSLDKAVDRYYRPTSEVEAAQAANSVGTSAFSDLAEFGDLPHPMLDVMTQNLQQAVKVQGEVIQKFKDRGLLDRPGRPGPATLVPVRSAGEAGPTTRPRADSAPTDTAAAQPPAGQGAGAAKPAASRRRRGTRFEVPLHVSLDEHPYLVDHSIVRQPPGWPIQEDLAPVVPLTMSIELMADIAQAQAPELKVVKIGPVMAMNFIPVNEPFDTMVKGFWKSDKVVSLSIDGHLMMDVTLAAAFPTEPRFTLEQLDADLGRDFAEPLSTDYTYSEYAFHGPMYQSSTKMTRFAQKGFTGLSEVKPGRGSLLDGMGQSLGLYLHLHEVENQISFPVRVEEIILHDDLANQNGVYESGLVVKSLTKNFIVGDMILQRDGQVWGTARGWANQRLPLDPVLWNVILHPERHVMSEEIAPGVHYVVNRNPNRQALAFVFIRYLGKDERVVCDARGADDQRSAFLLGRVALKDAVRTALQRGEGDFVYPVEIGTTYDEAGQVSVHPVLGEPWADDFHVSISHKPDRAIAAVRDHPVGVDLEEIVERDAGFLDLAFSPVERERLATRGTTAEWVTRFWVAKEAYGKMLGVGLAGQPRRHEVDFLDGDDVCVEGTRITTKLVDERYIVGWTN
jgi:3-oxoacyl-(acyl-carrier-protein) synthase/phosphopantetheinyl transferase/malonyl CoA-acyl carrier protein transacylase